MRPLQPRLRTHAVTTGTLAVLAVAASGQAARSSTPDTPTTVSLDQRGVATTPLGSVAAPNPHLPGPYRVGRQSFADL